MIRVAALDEILALREAVIIRGTGRTSPEFPGDRDPQTLHVGAFLGERNVSCGTFLLNEWKGRPAWQLRGMATDPEFRGRGYGAALLAHAEDLLRARSTVRIVWCNARRVAVDFYRKQGWSIASDEFPSSGIGMQRKMTRRL